MITSAAQALLATFDELSDDDKRAVIAELLRRNLGSATTPLSDDELTHLADASFLALEAEEAQHGQSEAR